MKQQSNPWISISDLLSSVVLILLLLFIMASIVPKFSMDSQRLEMMNQINLALKEYEKEGLVKYDSKYILTFLNRIIDTYICNSVLLNDGTCGKIVLMNQKALSRPVIHTITNEYIDLTKHPELYIQAII